MNTCLVNPDTAVVENIHPTTAQLRVIPLFAGLEEPDLLQIGKGLIRKCIPRNEYLFHQGGEADSAFFVLRGALDVVSALPGGGEVHLAKLGPGSMLGETSLVATGVRTASVRAQSDVVGFSMERWFFQGAIAQASPAAVRVLSQLIQIVSDRLQHQYARMVAVHPGSNIRVTCRGDSVHGVGIDATLKTCPFPYQAYLPRLEFFSNFQPDEIRAFESQVNSYELPQGAMLFEKGQSPQSCFFVIRGALELFIVKGNSHVPLGIMGPGTLLGGDEIISGGVRLACGRVRENAAIFEIDAGKLKELLSSESFFALKFQLALCESLIDDVGKINKRMARMTSQASLEMNSVPSD